LDRDEILEEAEVAAIESFYDEIVTPIRLRKWSDDPAFRTKMSFALRMLSQVTSGIAINDVSDIAFRYPDLLEGISNYLRRLADDEPEDVVTALVALHHGSGYADEYQRLCFASAAVALAPSGPRANLVKLLVADAADGAANPILRRRAGMAAVALSRGSGVSTVEGLWEAFDRLPDAALSKLYLVIGASTLKRSVRDQLFAKWTGESRLLTTAISILEAGEVFDMSRI
jgi:hypothetical protein